jgi:hypothetical protein
MLTGLAARGQDAPLTHINAPARNVCDLGVNTIRENLVPTTRLQPRPSAIDLIALALDHRIQAERCTCPAEQRELQRVADIYEVLATIDVPISTVEEFVSP